jgi:hypothetical protein
LRAIYVGYCFFREALHRVTGIDREASLLTTVFTAGVLANALVGLAAPLTRVFRSGRPRSPSLAEAAAGMGVGRFAIRSVAGEELRETPVGDAIIASWILAGTFKLITEPLKAVTASLRSAWRYVADPASRRVASLRR